MVISDHEGSRLRSKRSKPRRYPDGSRGVDTWGLISPRIFFGDANQSRDASCGPSGLDCVATLVANEFSPKPHCFQSETPTKPGINRKRRSRRVD